MDEKMIQKLREKVIQLEEVADTHQTQHTPGFDADCAADVTWNCKSAWSGGIASKVIGLVQFSGWRKKEQNVQVVPYASCRP